MSENFWNISASVSLKPPALILKEQAEMLSSSTNYRLEGHVQRTISQDGTNIVLKLKISVPSLGNYEYHVLTYEQPIEMYPGNLIYNVKGRSIYITDETQFIETLREILGSEEVGRIISSLQTQAKI